MLLLLLLKDQGDSTPQASRRHSIPLGYPRTSATERGSSRSGESSPVVTTVSLCSSTPPVLSCNRIGFFFPNGGDYHHHLLYMWWCERGAFGGSSASRRGCRHCLYCRCLKSLPLCRLCFGLSSLSLSLFPFSHLAHHIALWRRWREQHTLCMFG